jgi:hypothetical protein
VKNWLGHDIVEGAVVYRGGKKGTSSSFRIGVVDLLREDKATARVEWKWESGMRHIWFGEKYYDRDPRNYRVYGPHKSHTQRTSYGINDLVRVDDNMLDYLTKRDLLIDRAIELGVLEVDFPEFEKDFNLNY